MVRAILDGRKTQTRRVIEPQPALHAEPEGDFWHWEDCQWHNGGLGMPQSAVEDHARWKPSDRLWVKEMWNPVIDLRTKETSVIYRADGVDHPQVKWRSPRYMPRALTRILLIVTDVRSERLHDITQEDCVAEGVEYYDPGPLTYIAAKAWDIATARAKYVDLWDSLNAKNRSKHGFPWESNPWVWRTVFEREGA
jgi:hypothetical protein